MNQAIYVFIRPYETEINESSNKGLFCLDLLLYCSSMFRIQVVRTYLIGFFHGGIEFRFLIKR